MKKKLLILITAVMTFSLLAACSNSSSSKKADLTVWSFTDELQEPINVFKEENGVTVDLTIIPIEDYPTRLRPVLESGQGAPDVFTGELAFIKDWVEQDYWEDLSQEPYNVQEWEDDYVPYVFDLGKDSEGKIKAVSWQTTPGGIFYRRSIAKEVLGTDDPAEIGERMSSMDGLFEVGEELKSAGYRLFPDEGAVRWFAQGQDPQPWVNENNELVLTEGRINYFDYAKELRDKDLTAFAPEWSPAWFAAMDEPINYNAGWEEVDEESSDQTEVFAYALPTWGLHSVLKTNTEETVGDWAVTNGPNPYFWGGTWLGIYKGSENKDLAWKFVQMMTHDEEFLTDWATETGDVLSYLPVTEKIKGEFEEPFLGGQNNYTFFLEEAANINPGTVTRYDQQIDGFFGSMVGEYVEGTKTKEEAIEEFYRLVKNAYPDIKTPE
ncbi:sugar ABC transporter substrate-binding protein [Sutcliffiella horikoshii]|uniref:Carbohydrate ABC transporter substrate-binding protein n=1 Tax=Sutcliffiella horikoshii TaxID=79883 RepID=A0A1Y0CRF2_9BACI|nr:ABC transporter substrate-binding protein [Sutcliffiella horikoshii]ART77839.1 sugar ABC transporter substrate-binding protein [Sutcliffiella horikoshii]TYS60217.1 carbohydrate ABC transporter substrate-binding protein [Sutcliffiella horikoshii]